MSVAEQRPGPRHSVLTLLLVLVLTTSPAPTHAQEVVPGMTGAVLGLMAGGIVSVGIITLQARRGEFLFSPEDALRWESVAIPLGAAAGLVIGLGDGARARHALVGGVGGVMAGASLGALAGAVGWDRPEGPWAGGVIGAAAGVVTGVLVGVLLPGGEGTPADPRAAARLELRVPVP